MKLTGVLSNDWEAWYLDGLKLVEGHSVAAFQILEALQRYLPIEIENDRYLDDDAMEQIGWAMPDLLKDLPGA